MNFKFRLVENANYTDEAEFDSLEGLINRLEELILNIHREYAFSTKDGFDCFIWWHEPSLNLSYYPIVQIDYNDKTIFHRGGSENRDHYYEVIEEAIKVLKNKFLNINEAYSSDYENIPLIDKFNFINKRTNNLKGIKNIKDFIQALNNTGLDKFKIRTSKFGNNISEADIKDSYLDIKKNGWSIYKDIDNSLKGFKEVYICSKIK